MTNFLNKNYGLNDYNMQIFPYRLSGTDEYSNRDIRNLNHEDQEKLIEIFKNNNKEIEILKLESLPKQYKLEEKRIIEIPPIVSEYMKVEIYKVIDKDKGKDVILVDNYLNIFEFNDSKYGIYLNLNRSGKFYICEDFDGVLRYLHDMGFKI